ncbi:hypothetical protein VTJ49DRAFT_6882 [Mycothermus thermophilus]|uniref:Uncharacterized protein n=1 Tax=Humicola insolens TaxID=85995 RepID=A0ABR3VPW8_HUMIN
MMSQNINLLRGSLRLGQRFSKPSFLTELIEAAFAPIWEEYYGAYCEIFEPDTPVPGNYEFQGDILACPWLTADLMISAQQKWYRRNGGPGWWARKQAEASAEVLPRPSVAEGADAVATLFEDSWTTFRDRCASAVTSSSLGEDEVRSLVGLALFPDDDFLIEVHPSAPLPHRLFFPPFDWEKAKMLFWLARAGKKMRENWMWELSLNSYHEILKVEDPHLALVMFLLLARMGAFQTLVNWNLEPEMENLNQLLEHPKGPAHPTLWRHVRPLAQRRASMYCRECRYSLPSVAWMYIGTHRKMPEEETLSSVSQSAK